MLDNLVRIYFYPTIYNDTTKKMYMILGSFLISTVQVIIEVNSDFKGIIIFLFDYVYQTIILTPFLLIFFYLIIKISF